MSDGPESLITEWSKRIFRSQAEALRAARELCRKTRDPQASWGMYCSDPVVCGLFHGSIRFTEAMIVTETYSFGWRYGVKVRRGDVLVWVPGPKGKQQQITFRKALKIYAHKEASHD